jgi:endoribonuclease Dicer
MPLADRTQGHVDHRPLFDIDPPDMPEGWHSFENRSTAIKPYLGPYGAKVTLPRLLPSNLRVFETERVHRTKTSAVRHAAFYAYRALYEHGLLSDSLLPLTSVVEPELEAEVKALLAEVEKRAGTAKVSLQMNPWVSTEIPSIWYTSELVISGLQPLLLFTRSKPPAWSGREAPILHRPGSQDTVTLQPFPLEPSPRTIARAQEYTRRLFWCMNGSRMNWDDLEFSYLFLPPNDSDDAAWDARRLWHNRQNSGAEPLFTNAHSFGTQFSYPNDLAIVRNGPQFNKAFKFVRWRLEPLSPEEETEMKKFYARFSELEISYPLIVVENLPPRTNFLVPIPEKGSPPTPPKTFHLLPRLAFVTLCSQTDVQYAFLLPSVLRSLAISMTINSMRETLLSNLGLGSIPQPLLTTALCAPVSQERGNYQVGFNARLHLQC